MPRNNPTQKARSKKNGCPPPDQEAMKQNLLELFHAAGNNALFDPQFNSAMVLNVAGDTVFVGHDNVSFKILCRACCCEHSKKLVDGTAETTKDLSDFCFSPQSFIANHLRCWASPNLVRFPGISPPWATAADSTVQGTEAAAGAGQGTGREVDDVESTTLTMTSMTTTSLRAQLRVHCQNNKRRRERQQ